MLQMYKKFFGRASHLWVAAFAIGVIAPVANTQAATVIQVTGDTYIDVDNPSTNYGASEKILSNRMDAINPGSRYGLLYFDIPQSVLNNFSTAWDSAGGNAFGTVKAVLQINSITPYNNSGNFDININKAGYDWYGTSGESATWNSWDGGAGPIGAGGGTSAFVGITPNDDGRVPGRQAGTLQFGVMNTGPGNQGVARTILDWAADAGVGPTTGYGTADVRPNYGFAVVPNFNSRAVELTTKEYAAAHGPQYASKLILYREPSPEDQVRVMDSTNAWDVYQATNMVATSNPVGGPRTEIPYFPTVPFPADQSGVQWFEAGYNITGPGWNAAPDDLYNATPNGAFVNIAGTYGQPSASGVNTMLDGRFSGLPDGGGDATARENGSINARIGYLFRTEFDAPDAADVDILRMNLRYSGSARVYLNGVEVLDLNFDDEVFRATDGTFGIPFEGGNELAYTQAPGLTETAEIYFNDPAFAGLLLPTGNTLAVFATKQSTGQAPSEQNFAFRMNYVDLLYNTDLVPGQGIDGDLNGDGFVGQDDLNLILGNWGQNVTPGDPLFGDPSGDGFVGQDDLNQVLGGWGQGTPPVEAVPEPGSLLLMALAGIGGLAAYRKRTRHQS